MRITKGRLTPYQLPLRHPWRSAHGILESRRGWLVTLCNEEGQCGFGDCAPLPEAGSESSELSLTTLQSFLDEPVGTGLGDWGSDTPAARCAIETALLDLRAQDEGLTLARLLNPGASDYVRVNANLGTLGEGVTARLDAAGGCPVIKLKVGLVPVDEELARLRQLVPQLAPSTRLRLDANQTWDEDEAERFIAGLAGLPIESLEEPLRIPDLAAYARLQSQANFSLALDESLHVLSLEAVAKQQAADRVVIKPGVAGGPAAGYTLGRRAQALGLEVVVTSMVESAIGVWAACHLAAALDPAAEMAHGLATSRWLAEDCAAAPQVREGVIRLPAASGLGIVPDGCGGG